MPELTHCWVQSSSNNYLPPGGLRREPSCSGLGTISGVSQSRFGSQCSQSSSVPVSASLRWGEWYCPPHGVILKVKWNHACKTPTQHPSTLTWARCKPVETHGNMWEPSGISIFLLSHSPGTPPCCSPTWVTHELSQHLLFSPSVPHAAKRSDYLLQHLQKCCKRESAARRHICKVRGFSVLRGRPELLSHPGGTATQVRCRRRTRGWLELAPLLS